MFVPTLCDLSINCLCRTNYNRHVSLFDPPRLPLPSIVEEIVADESFAFALPLPIANGLIEELARRGKLTPNVLDSLLNPRRAKLSSLPLHCLSSVNEAPFYDGLEKQTNISKLDISFSPCFADLRTPLLERFPVSCRDTLVYFAANHVKGDIGLPLLSNFVNLRHLDVSFTSIQYDQLQSVLPVLNQLERLYLSGTVLTWYQIFMAAKSNLPNLRHLEMSCLTFLDATEYDAVSDPEFSTKWISQFFSGVPKLSALNISYTRIDHNRDRHLLQFADSFRAILANSPSLTHLETTTLPLPDIVKELQATEKLSQLRFLGYFGYIDSIPNELKSCENLKMALRSSDGTASHFGCLFRDQYAQGDGDLFRDASLFFRSFLYQHYDDFTDSGLVSFTSMLRTAFRRLQTDKAFYFALESELSSWSDWYEYACFSPGSSTYMSAMWEQLFELSLQYVLSRAEQIVCHLSQAVFNLLNKFANFISERQPLLYLGLLFITKTVKTSDDGLVALASLLDKLTDEGRSRLALEGKLLRNLCDRLAIILNERETALEDLDTPDTDSTTDWDIYRDRCTDHLIPFTHGGLVLLKAFKQACFGLPQVLESLSKSPEYIKNFAVLAIKGADEYNHGRGDPILYVGAMEILAAVAEFPQFRSSLLCLDVIKSVVAVHGFGDDSMLLASSYLGCLLLLSEDSTWSNEWPSKETVLKESISDTLNRSKFIAEGHYFPLVTHHVSFSPLLEMAKCSHVPEVAAFALWRLTFFCSESFDSDRSQYMGKCPICLIKEEITVEVISTLAVPSSFPDVHIDLDAIVSRCRSHEDHHLA